MKTYRITEKEIEGMKPLAVGYKIFKPDWKANNGYCYADENGEVLDSIHTVDGEISECKWGLHFSKKPQDCFNFYESVQWNRFAKVEAYGECFDSDNGYKSVAKTIKIVETYTFDEFIRLIQQSLQSNGVNYSDGVNSSNGVNRSYGITECDGISYSIFCYKKSGKLYVFNKKTTQERYNEIMLKIRAFCWYPKFNNAEELKGNREWFETNIPDIVSVPNKVAWSFMPKDMKEYLQSLPEYSEKVFKKVTGKIDE